ncbi:spastin [Reticulomyxa filosa]|uniref:Spastin n=1 Tax=Reticulomyxa filosa TaxID=46433 RepID=X6M667_RETFI|nr:spastin [Reticulomyxa filosa]|eukprot:ETO08952.1 spastin [Reticulomyxa filosa]
MSKWYGDSQKYISALFSLAKKMAPSIVWIDEIDALFSQRSRNDHQADVYNKALFLSLWDGLASPTTSISDDIQSSSLGEDEDYSDGNGGSQVIILGATNRPHEVDEAFLRRMGRQYEFEMPDKKTRRLILYILLQYEQYDATINLDTLAENTDQYSAKKKKKKKTEIMHIWISMDIKRFLLCNITSPFIHTGSDLKELCKYAATLPLREYVRNKKVENQDENKVPFVSDILDDESNIKIDEDSIPTATAGEEQHESNMADNSKDSWKSWYNITPDFLSRKSNDNNHSKSERAMDHYTNRIRSSTVKLRPISMKDFNQALEHIKSTLKAHKQHESKFGQPSSLLNLWGSTAGLTNIPTSTSSPKKVISLERKSMDVFITFVYFCYYNSPKKDRLTVQAKPAILMIHFLWISKIGGKEKKKKSNICKKTLCLQPFTVKFIINQMFTVFLFFKQSMSHK